MWHHSKYLLLSLLIILATSFSYWDSLNNGFLPLWDTDKYVISNDSIKSFSWENLQWMFTQVYMTNWHPLTWISHAIDYALFGLDPWGHHFTHLVFHNLNSLLVFLLGVILMPQTVQGTLAAGLAALFFGIHPQHVESVAWIAERKDVLCQFFTLLSLIFYVLFTRRSNLLRYYFSALFCFLLALLSKFIH